MVKVALEFRPRTDFKPEHLHGYWAYDNGYNNWIKCFSKTKNQNCLTQPVLWSFSNTKCKRVWCTVNTKVTKNKFQTDFFRKIVFQNFRNKKIVLSVNIILSNCYSRWDETSRKLRTILVPPHILLSKSPQTSTVINNDTSQILRALNFPQQEQNKR